MLSHRQCVWHGSSRLLILRRWIAFGGLAALVRGVVLSGLFNDLGTVTPYLRYSLCSGLSPDFVPAFILGSFASADIIRVYDHLGVDRACKGVEWCWQEGRDTHHGVDAQGSGGFKPVSRSADPQVPERAGKAAIKFAETLW